MNSSILILAIVMLVLLFLKVPVYIAVLAASAIYFVITPGANFVVFAQQFVGGVESLTLLAIPFFVSAGIFMNMTGVTKRIMNMTNILTSRMYGGLGQVNVLLSTLMGGLSGSSLADAAMQCKLLVPSMEKAGFSKAYSTVLTAATGMIVPIIPPSVGMIIYGSVTNTSIGKLFISGIVPGILMCITYMIMVKVYSMRNGINPSRIEKLSINEKVEAIKPAILPMLLPIIIIGGIRIGAFSATEAGAVAIVYAIVLGLFYREITLEGFIDSCKETIATSSSILFIVASASVFSWILTKERVPQNLTNLMITTISNKYVFLFIVNIFLLIVGMFIEGNAAMIVLAPLLAPVASGFGIDPIHFGIMYVFNSAIGAFSPPMGTLIFVTTSITGASTKEFIKESVPFYIMLGIALMILTYVPIVSTFMVKLLY